MIRMLLLIFLSTASRADTLSKLEQRQVYDEAVHILGGNANVIARWVDDIQYAIVGVDPESDKIFTTAQDTFNAIAAQTGLLPIQIQHDFTDDTSYLEFIRDSAPYNIGDCVKTSDSACANFIVLFSDVDTMKEVARAIPLRSVYQRAFDNPDAVVCFFAPFQTSAQEIRRAFVYIRKDLSEAMMSTCLHEEIYQSFGLFNDFSGSRYFSFNNLVEPKVITTYDRALLKAVYDPQFKPGAPVFAVVNRLMESLGYDVR